MTKKHFIALADAIRDYNVNRKPGNPSRISAPIRNELADFCQSQNPRFNRERWLGYIAGTNGKNGGAIKP